MGMAYEPMQTAHRPHDYPACQRGFGVRKGQEAQKPAIALADEDKGAGAASPVFPALGAGYDVSNIGSPVLPAVGVPILWPVAGAAAIRGADELVPLGQQTEHDGVIWINQLPWSAVDVQNSR